MDSAGPGPPGITLGTMSIRSGTHPRVTVRGTLLGTPCCDRGPPYRVAGASGYRLSNLTRYLASRLSARDGGTGSGSDQLEPAELQQDEIAQACFLPVTSAS